MRSRYRVLESKGIHFITSTTVQWLPVFTSDKYFRLFINSLKYCQKYKDLKIYAYVILDNHFHMIVSANNLSNTIQSLKRFTAQNIISLAEKQSKEWLLNQLSYYKKGHKLNCRHQIWQEGFYPEYIMSDKMLFQKINYIHNNPVKRGYVDKPEYWKYSSARNIILDDHSIIELDSLPVLLI